MLPSRVLAEGAPESIIFTGGQLSSRLQFVFLGSPQARSPCASPVPLPEASARFLAQVLSGYASSDE